MSKFKVPFKVKVDSIERYDETFVAFKEMLEGWKYKKEGRDFVITGDKEGLEIKIEAIVK